MCIQIWEDLLWKSWISNFFFSLKASLIHFWGLYYTYNLIDESSGLDANKDYILCIHIWMHLVRNVLRVVIDQTRIRAWQLILNRFIKVDLDDLVSQFNLINQFNKVNQSNWKLSIWKISPSILIVCIYLLCERKMQRTQVATWHNIIVVAGDKVTDMEGLTVYSSV